MTSKATITVIGDLMLDRYLHGTATRVNPEGPGVVVRVDRVEERLGGAASVAWLSAGMGAQVELAGVIGEDAAGERILDLVADAGIRANIVRLPRTTTVKQRVIANGVLMADRCDFETCDPVPDEVASDLSAVPFGEAILVSDYAKGVCSIALIERLIGRSLAAGLPVLVDPAAGVPWDKYRGATLMKCNAREAFLLCGQPPNTAAAVLSSQYKVDTIVTAGCDGAFGVVDCRTWHEPAKPAVVHDVTGAGDTVLATLGIGVARGLDLQTACRAAMHTASQQVSQLGVSHVRYNDFNRVTHKTRDPSRVNLNAGARSRTRQFSR